MTEKVIQGAVIGYRAWRILNWQLYGTGVSRSWALGVNEATCSESDTEPANTSHLAPTVGCNCGITALARDYRYDLHWSFTDVFGAIAAWSDQDGEEGRFVLHRNGFRAQYAKAVLLALEDEWPLAKKAAVRALAQEHGADVCKRPHLEDAAKEHGQLIPDEMLAWAREGEPEEPGPLTAANFITVSTANTYFSSISAPVITVSAHPVTVWNQPLWTPPRNPPSPRKAGICQVLRYVGPPSRGRFYKGQRVKDRKGTVWCCVKGGNPGSWEAEA